MRLKEVEGPHIGEICLTSTVSEFRQDAADVLRFSLAVLRRHLSFYERVLEVRAGGNANSMLVHRIRRKARLMYD